MAIPMARHNQCDTLASNLKAGARLGIYLKPSADIKRRGSKGSYIEHLKLPHAVIKDDGVWAFQERHQPNHTRGKSFDGFGYFAYTNTADLFANVGFDSRVDCMKDQRVLVQIMSTGRYETLEWRIKTDTRLVWTSDDANHIDDFNDAIIAGADFHMVMLTEDGLWRVHPVHYPFLLDVENPVHIQTHSEFYPAVFENTDLLAEIDRRSPGILQFDNPAGREDVLRMSAQAKSTYLSARGNGDYYGLFDIFKVKDSRYRSLKIFARD